MNFLPSPGSRVDTCVRVNNFYINGEAIHGIHLVCVDMEEVVQRMKRRAEIQNRPDDADESVIRRRFEVYAQETQPVLGHYDTSLVHDVTAVGNPGDILLNILEKVIPAIKGHFGNPLG